MKILIFSGTSDGNELVKTLVEKGYIVLVSVATKYGREFVTDTDATILTGRLNTQEIQELIIENKIECVVDATHPYAVEVSRNIELATQSAGVKSYRLLREESLYESHVTLVDSIPNACELATLGNVLATTGSKQIHEYTVLSEYEKRLYARVLPTDESVQLCENIGLAGKHIITSIGALSVEENINTIKQYNIKNMITKDGGVKGGFPQKSEACRLTGVQLFVVKRPSDTGYSIEEILDIIGD